MNSFLLAILLVKVLVVIQWCRHVLHLFANQDVTVCRVRIMRLGGRVV